jgi:hypothetical protein
LTIPPTSTTCRATRLRRTRCGRACIS